MAQQPKSYKKFVATAATATLVASAIVPVASANVNTAAFSDVAPQYKDAVDFLVTNNISKGYSETQYGISMQIKRGDAAIMIANAAGLNDNEAAAAGFSDVPKRGSLAVNSLKAAGVIDGKTETRFGFEDNITRGEAALMLQRAFDLKSGDTKNDFSDVSNRYDEAVDALVANKVTKGINDTQFGTQNNIKRGDFAMFLYALKDQVVVDGVDVEGVTVQDHETLTVAVTEADKELTAKDFNISVDGEMVKAEKVESDGTGKNYTITIPSLDGDKGIVKVNGKTANYDFSVTGITGVKAINDTRVEVTFNKEVDKDFIREAELNGKYFAIYTEGNSVQSKDTVQSNAINFSADGKTATFDLDKAVESGKKYYVALLDSDNNEVADVKYTYGPTVLKSAADAPSFDVSAVADKVYVSFNSKMKDTAKDVANYTVYDEGGKKLGALSDYIAKNSKGEWVNLNDKDQVEFTLGVDSEKKLQAGKTYKLVVDEGVETDDNKKLSESNRTIKVKTPSVKDASPTAKVARITAKDEVTLYFDQDIVAPDGEVNLNAAQLNLKTSTGKTVDMEQFDKAVVKGDKENLNGNNALVISFKTDVFDKGITYKVDMPANVVQNGIFTNAMNDSTTGLTAQAQENVSISSMKAQIQADAKNDAKADLVLTFDQVPDLDALNKEEIVLYDGRDKYEFQGNKEDIKVYGSDTSGKSIIVEGMSAFHNDKKGNLVVRGDKSYDIEIAKGELTTDSFDESAKATNKDKLKATTKGISVSAPSVDEVRLQSAEKVEIEFKEEIKGDVEASDISLNAYVANRSDIFDNTNLREVSGSGYYDVKVSGKVMTITAKTGVKFPTSINDTNVQVDGKSFTNASGKVGNAPIVVSNDVNKTVSVDDVVDNAAPEIVAVYADSAKKVQVTYTESVTLQGSEDDIATLFFTDKGEKATEGVEYTGSGNTATITFKDAYQKNSTDLSVVTLKYSQGNSYYIQDDNSNKMDTNTVKGFYKDGSSVTPPSNSQADIDAATDAVVKAEGSKTQADVDAAQELIDGLVSSTVKTDLQNRLDKVEVPSVEGVTVQSLVDEGVVTFVENFVTKQQTLVLDSTKLTGELAGKEATDLELNIKGEKLDFVANQFKLTQFDVKNTDYTVEELKAATISLK